MKKRNPYRSNGRRIGGLSGNDFLRHRFEMQLSESEHSLLMRLSDRLRIPKVGVIRRALKLLDAATQKHSRGEGR